MTRVLVAEDSPTQAMQVRMLLEDADFEVCHAENGIEALKQIPIFNPEVVLTDLEMPEMDGLQLVEAIKQQHKMLPVVLMTARGSEEIAMKALKTGAAKYFPKRVMEQVLVETIHEVAGLARTYQSEQLLLSKLQRVEYCYNIGNDSSLVQPLVSHLGNDAEKLNAFDEINLMQITMALTEALTNAINHGNLELSSELREEDDGTEKYHKLAEKRRQEEPYRSRSVIVQAKFSDERLEFVVSDEGPGFDAGLIPDPTDAANLEKASGRGLMLIHTFMDEVVLKEPGNQITMIKHCPPPNGKPD